MVRLNDSRTRVCALYGLWAMVSCTGVILLNLCAHLCALYEPQGTIAVHRSLVRQLLCTF